MFLFRFVFCDVRYRSRDSLKPQQFFTRPFWLWCYHIWTFFLRLNSTILGANLARKKRKTKNLSRLRLTYCDRYIKIDTFFLRRPSPMTEMKHTKNTQKSLHCLKDLFPSVRLWGSWKYWLSHFKEHFFYYLQFCCAWFFARKEFQVTWWTLQLHRLYNVHHIIIVIQFIIF